MKRIYLLVFTALLMLTSLGATETPTKPPDGNPPPCCGNYCNGHQCCYIPYCSYLRNHGSKPFSSDDMFIIGEMVKHMNGELADTATGGNDRMAP